LDLNGFISGGFAEGIYDVKISKFLFFFWGEEQGNLLKDFANVDFALNKRRITMYELKLLMAYRVPSITGRILDMKLGSLF
jgi:hypothetical protein